MKQILLVSAAAAFIIALLVGPIYIPLLRRLKVGQSIRQEGPKSHFKKQGTPTMGGVIFLTSILLTTLFYAVKNSDFYLLLVVTVGYGLIGFLDDFIKVGLKRNLGLTAKQKLFGQLVIALIFYYGLLQRSFDHSIYLPGTNIGWDLGWFYLPFLIILFLATTNAVNLHDGLDGLLAGSSAITFSAYAVIAWALSEWNVATYSAVIVGAVLGFLVYNRHPAKVFMGDTGSLALGGALAGIAVLTKTELLLIILGGVYVIETLSVIIQVLSFKLRGKRVFRMSPIHHHFELVGWSEWRVVITFWIISLIFAILGIYIEVYAA